MRRVMWGVLVAAILAGCTVLPATITKPTNMSPVLGGLADVNPFFGNFRFSNTADEGKGIFLLASCGCGDWRVLFKPDDGSAQRQFTVQFFTNGEYQANGMVTVYGEDNGEQLIATVDQDAGMVAGRTVAGFSQRDVAGIRSSAHVQPVEACGLCHIGDNPIYPLPPNHPQKYKTNPNVCFECHTVNGQ